MWFLYKKSGHEPLKWKNDGKKNVPKNEQNKQNICAQKKNYFQYYSKLVLYFFLAFSRSYRHSSAVMLALYCCRVNYDELFHIGLSFACPIRLAHSSPFHFHHHHHRLFFYIACTIHLLYYNFFQQHFRLVNAFRLLLFFLIFFLLFCATICLNNNISQSYCQLGCCFAFEHVK